MADEDDDIPTDRIGGQAMIDTTNDPAAAPVPVKNGNAYRGYAGTAVKKSSTA